MRVMKNNLLILFAFFLSATALSAQEVVELNLRESLTYALENNVNTKNSRLETLISKATVKETTATGLPQITGAVNLNYNPTIPVVFLPNQPPFGDPTNPSDVIPARFGVSFQSGVAINVTQMVLDGSFFVGLKAAKTFQALTQLDVVKAENDVIENVKKAFFGVLVNQERIRLASANLSRIDSLLSETQSLFDAGFSEKIDVSRIKVQRNNTYSQLERSKTAFEISKQLLKLQMGLPPQYDINITETLSELNPEEELVGMLTMEGISRIEIDQLNTNMELTNLDLRYNKAQYMPTIDATGYIQRTGAGNTLQTVYDPVNWFSSSLIGLRMEIPIFDGLAKSARIQKNRLQLNQLENQKIFLDDNISLEIYEARTSLRNDLNILDVQRENMALAQEVFDMAKIKYNEGVGSNFEVVEADASLIEAEINFLAALYDGLIAKVDLEKALGILRTNIDN
jgi:outer membrane protein TolC